MWLVQIIFLALFNFFYISSIQSCWVPVSRISLILEGTCTLFLSLSLLYVMAGICVFLVLSSPGLSTLNVWSSNLILRSRIDIKYVWGFVIKKKITSKSKREQSINLRIQKQGSRDERSNEIEKAWCIWEGKEMFSQKKIQHHHRHLRKVEISKKNPKKWVSTNDIHWQQRFNYSFFMIIIWVTKLFNWSVLDAIK